MRLVSFVPEASPGWVRVAAGAGRHRSRAERHGQLAPGHSARLPGRRRPGAPGRMYRVQGPEDAGAQSGHTVTCRVLGLCWRRQVTATRSYDAAFSTLLNLFIAIVC